MKLKPLGKNLIIEQSKVQGKTASGLTTGSTERPNEGLVLAVGEEITTIKNGDKVLFSLFGGNVTKYDGKEFLMLKEHDILAIIKQ
tara:strand:+ start:367 stop:624 length:258 start_codon:yes stop_codon:yes gene_type:complete